MKQIFRLENGSIVDELLHSADVVRREIKNDLRIYIGCDSQNKRYGTTYVTVIAYRYGTRGTHFIYCREKVKKIKDRWQRLWGEVERAVSLAVKLQQNGFKIHCVDLDFNKKEIARSSDMVSAARGYVIGSGFNCSVKPEEQCASRAADHMVRR